MAAATLAQSQHADDNGDNDDSTSSNGHGQKKKKETDVVDQVFAAVTTVLTTCRGSYAGIYIINGIGLVGFRDPHGIRPIVLGSRPSSASTTSDSASDPAKRDCRCCSSGGYTRAGGDSCCRWRRT